MTMFNVLFVILFSVLASLVLFGVFLLEAEKDKRDINPKYRGWKVDENDEDQDK